jgi:DNA repair exonuclease SbcCD ATPase subunit/DNA repair exonuclease SbcCD nuclease subunit
MRKIKYIDIGVEKIDKIYHIADVHIRNLKRHKEYREVFSQLYGHILSTMGENDIIYIAGDIVHAKTDMSPEVVDLTQEFFCKLADLLPTIVIPGNHDANLNNTSRLDALSPIMKALDHKNLYYLRDTGGYGIGGYTFIHKSIWDTSEGFPQAKDYKKNNGRIGVFHGPVDNIETEHGFVIQNKNVKVSHFTDFDLVLLGDIHKPNNSVMGNSHIKYPGSLIVQNHGEAKYPKHGILVWDMETLQSKFIEVHNDYGYVTIDIENGKIVSDNYIPNKPRIRVRVKDTKTSQLNKLIAEIKKGRDVQELTVQKVLTRKRDVEHQSIVLQNVRDTGFQNKLISEYLEETDHLTKEQLEVVTQINNDINDKLGKHNVISNSTWIPRRFEFSNMFSYGTNNVIDFTNMKGAYGIFAPNASGKSTLWDALSFCMFDKCSRTIRAEDVLNYSKMGFDCKFQFELNNVQYFIERKAKKSPKRGTVKVDVEFYRIVDGERQSLNGEQRRETNAIIREYIGTYEDFVLTAMSTQSNSSGFIEKSQKERKELLAQFLDMDVFEDLWTIASEEIRELNTLLREYKKEDFPSQLIEAEQSLTSITGSLDELQERKDELELKLDNTNMKMEFEMRTLKPVEDIGDIETLESKLDEVKVLLDNQNSECDFNKLQINDIEAKQKDIESKLKKLNIKELKGKNIKYETLNIKFNDLEKQSQTIELDLKHMRSHLDGIGQLTFDDNCEHCVQNKNTPFAKQAEQLQKDIKSQNSKYEKLIKTKIKVLEDRNDFDVRNQLQDYESLVDEQLDLGKEWLNATKVYDECIKLVDNYKSEIQTLSKTIDKANKQQQAVEHNKLVNERIDSFKNTRETLKDKISEVNEEVMSINSDIKLAEKSIQQVNESIEKLRDMEIKYDGYEFYLKCVRRDGIPYQLISEVLPKLEIEINNILQPIVDFQVLLNTDGKNINSYIAYGTDEYWPLELTSGMEKFISSIAIRTALINVSNLPRPNFIAIDEGFGSLDTDNFNSLYLLFDYLKTQFDFIVTISHIDKTRDMVDQIIDISKVRGFSKVSYL